MVSKIAGTKLSECCQAVRGISTRTTVPRGVHRRNDISTSALMTCPQACVSRPQRRAACAGVSCRPGISLNSLRIRLTRGRCSMPDGPASAGPTDGVRKGSFCSTIRPFSRAADSSVHRFRHSRRDPTRGRQECLKTRVLTPQRRRRPPPPFPPQDQPSETRWTRLR